MPIAPSSYCQQAVDNPLVASTTSCIYADNTLMVFGDAKAYRGHRQGARRRLCSLTNVTIDFSYIWTSTSRSSSSLRDLGLRVALCDHLRGDGTRRRPSPETSPLLPRAIAATGALDIRLLFFAGAAISATP